MKYIFLFLLLSVVPSPAFCNESEDTQFSESIGEVVRDEGYDFILDYKIQETDAYKTIMGDYEWDLNHLKISGEMFDNVTLKYYLDKMTSEEPFPIEETFVR